MSDMMRLVLERLKPGQRVAITQLVRVGNRSWTARVIGTVREVTVLATGLATERGQDQIVVTTVHFTKDNHELSSVVVDENTKIELLHSGVYGEETPMTTEPTFPDKKSANKAFVMTMKRAELRYAGNLKLLELVIDKGVFGVIVALVGVLLLIIANHNNEEFKNRLANTLEESKNRLAKTLEEDRTRLALKNFLAQERYQSLSSVIKANNKLFKLFLDNTRKEQLKKKDHQDYVDAIQNVFDVHNEKELAIPRQFSGRVEKVGFLYRGVRDKGFLPKYVRFFNDLGEQLSQMGRDILDPPPTDKMHALFPLDELPEDAQRTRGPAPIWKTILPAGGSGSRGGNPSALFPVKLGGAALGI
jgi:hypothetical protein